MKEFVNKLISRLKKERKRWNDNIDFLEQTQEYQDRRIAVAKSQGYSGAYFNAIEIVNQLAEEYKGGWIPCNKKLPKNWEYVHATCISLIDDREPWVIEGFYNNITGWKELTPMIYLGHAEVIAWKPYKLPAPYKPKGE